MRQGGMDSFIMILYLAITLFFAYRLFKTYKNKGKLSGDVKSFGRKTSGFEIGLIGVLAITAVINLYQGLTGTNTGTIGISIIMLILAIVFWISTKNQLFISENGMLANSSFYTYKELKKWGFDKDNGDLVLNVKKDGNLTNEIVKVKKEDIDEIQTLIKRYKLNK